MQQVLSLHKRRIHATQLPGTTTLERGKFYYVVFISYLLITVQLVVTSPIAKATPDYKHFRIQLSKYLHNRITAIYLQNLDAGPKPA